MFVQNGIELKYIIKSPIINIRQCFPFIFDRQLRRLGFLTEMYKEIIRMHLLITISLLSYKQQLQIR